MIIILYTMSTTPNTTVDAKHILFIFPKLLMITTRTKEFAMQKSTKPVCFFYVILESYLKNQSIHHINFRKPMFQQFNNQDLPIKYMV